MEDQQKARERIVKAYDEAVEAALAVEAGIVREAERVCREAVRDAHRAYRQAMEELEQEVTA